MNERLKSLTIIIPTYNCGKRIGNCVKAILNQDYPKKLLQIIVVDGGSQDNTIEIANSLGVKVLKNPYRIEEKAKPIGVRSARGEIIGFLDSDNIIPDDKEWLRRMIKIFDDKEVFSADSLYYDYRKEDNLVTKYCALVGGDDIMAIYLWINDRFCYFTGKAIEMEHEEEDKGDWIKVKLKKEKIPATGANGFFFRKKLFNEVESDPFIHPIFIYDMVNKGYYTIGKAKQGIIHVQEGGLRTYFKKKLRRIRRRREKEVEFKYNYGMNRKNVIMTSLYLITIILPLKDMIVGFYKKPSLAWILHPIITYGTFFMYAYYNILDTFTKK